MATTESTRGELIDKVVKIRRCAAVVKGGRRFSFNALVVVGDGKGKVGWGYGKANEVPPSVEKAVKDGSRGIIAGAAVRAVCEACGIRDILTKSFGTSNQINLVKATIDALRQLRTQSDVERLRGVSLS